MRNFIVLKNGEHLDVIRANGNLKALCTAMKVAGIPDFPIHAHEGELLAKIGADIYMVFDWSDSHAHQVAEGIINEKRVPAVKKKRISLIPSLFRLPQLPVLTMETPAYVV